MPAPNVQEVQVPCSLFLGLNTEVSPPDLPEGVSPACADVAFVPGGASSRPCLHKVFATPFPPTGSIRPSVTWAKTFNPPNEDPLNLYQTSDGNLWYEDVVNAPGVYVNLATVIPGLRVQSITCDGAEYIAASDGLHGVDIPRQFYRGPDGTLFLDRVSQDGPGAGPSAANVVPLPATIASPGFGATVNIATAPTGIVFGGSLYSGLYYAYFTVTTTTPHGLSPDQNTTISGSISAVNGNWLVNSVPSPTTLVILYQYGKDNLPGGTGGGGTIKSGEASLSRTNNIVTAETTAANGFQVGWQVQISGITNSNIGGGIASISRDANGVVTVTTTDPHGLPALAPVAIVGVTDPDGSFNGVFQVSTVPSPTSFTYILGGTVEASASGTGNVQDIWDTTAFVQAILSPTSFTYQQLGADDSTNSGGTATIVGQVSPGVHYFAVAFQTRSGYITQPSPPVPFTANGNSQISITDIPVGPANVVARILIFTGAGGANYFYIPVTPTVGTQIVGTSMVINDNVTTSTILDFSDTTLFGGIGVDIPGNNIFAQNVLGPVLGFFSYASRLAAWGQRNKIQNFLNMGFDGGNFAGAPDAPTGWTAVDGLGALIPGGAWAAGAAWQINTNGISGLRSELTQPAYQDGDGIAIVQPGTRYTVRLWAINPSSHVGGGFSVEFYSATAGSLASANFPISTIGKTGEFYELEMTAATPAAIPADAILRVYGSAPTTGTLALVDEIEIFPTFNPYLDSQFAVSYVDNFEAFDGVTGVMGPTSDPTPLRGCETLRDQLQFLTAGGMHSTSDNGQEPSSWTVTEISNDTGLVASQGIDAGEECIVFISKSGGGDGSAPTYALRIYEGQQPWKISQEVQQIFDNVNSAAEQTMWLVNDIGQRRFYIGVPTGTATAPNQLYVLDYREIDTAYQIAQAPSIHISFTGKMIASDLARKWAPWNIPANCGAMLSRSATNVQFCLGGGNGVTPGEETAFGNVYYLDPLKFTDDDYGTMSPFYTMYFFISRDNETALGVGSMRKLYKRVSEFVTGIGNWTLTPYAASLTNPWPSPPSVQLSASATEDFYHGLNVSTERMAVKFSITPLSGETDVQFTLQHMEATVMQHPMSPSGTGAAI